MDLTGLDKDSKMMPLLVSLYDAQQLYALAKEDKPGARRELAGIICDLLNVTENEREAGLIADVLVSLIRQAEKDLKEALAERLAVMDNVPLRVALSLANDEIDVARPMLIGSKALGDLDLIYIIKSKDSEYWQAIAQRAEMGDRVIVMLSETHDNKTVLNLLSNNDIVLPKAALQVVGKMAETSENIARSLLLRKEVDNDMVAALYRIAGQELKKFIARNHSVNTDALIDTIDDVVLEFEGVGASEFTPNNSMVATAGRQQEKGLLTVPAMLGTLRRGQIQSFIAQFSVYTGVSVQLLESALGNADGKTFAMICKACDLEKQDFVTIYLLTNRMRRGSQMVDMAELSRAVNFYNRADAAKARETLRIKGR